MTIITWALALAVFLGLGGIAEASVARTRLVAYSAASLRDPLREIARRMEGEKGVRVEFVFASSGALARKIASGAPADAFLSANRGWVAYLERRKRLAPAAGRAIALNTLVCATPAGSRLRLAGPEALRGAGRIGLGDPVHVPAGAYARDALVSLGLWRPLREAGQLVFAPDARAALAFVERGAVRAGIVYATDARRSKRVRIAFSFPAWSHPPIAYFAGAVTGRPAEAAARAFVAHLAGPAARRVFARHGFALPSGPEERP
ncbi:MAG: molybdate ABC transporter substrate-binding protein [bacterium]